MKRRDLIIALELTSPEAEVAVGVAGGRPEVLRVSQHGRQGEALFSTLAQMTQRAGREPTDLKCVHVSIGPGGFTGIRTGATAAKMLALATGCKIVAVPTCDVVAWGACKEQIGNDGDGRLAVVLACKGDSAIVATYHASDGQPKRVSEPVLADVGEVIGQCEAGWICADAATLAMMRTRGFEGDMRIVEARFSAEACWEAGQAMAERGMYADPMTLTPYYGREPEAVRLWEQRRNDEIRNPSGQR